MTTFKAIEFLIENKSIDYSTASSALFEAYTHRKIDGSEYDTLLTLAINKLRD